MMKRLKKVFVLTGVFLALFIVFTVVTSRLPQSNDELFNVERKIAQDQVQPTANGRAYYVDSLEGNDSADGLNETTAWSTLKKVSSMAYNSGDHIYFKRNQIHRGELAIRSSGTEPKRIIFGAYGEGAKPIIRSVHDFDDKSGISTFWIDHADYITLQNLDIQGGQESVLVLGSDYLIIEGSNIGNGSSAGIRITGRNSRSTGSHYGILRQNVIDSGRRGDFGDLQATNGITLTDGASNWEIFDNEIRAWAHSGISINQIFTDFESAYNKIHDNVFIGSDIDYMRAFETWGGEGRVHHNEFYRNYIKDQTVTSHVHGHHNKFYYNIFDTIKPSSATQEPWAFDLTLFVNTQSGAFITKGMVNHDNEITNNIIYNAPGPGVMIIGSVNNAYNQVENNVISNNIFFNTQGGISILNRKMGGNIIADNVIFNTDKKVVMDVFGKRVSVSEFNNLDGEKNFTIQGNREINPQFVDPQVGDFRSKADAQMSNVGIPSNVLENFVF
ncbi:right-handed parallel beta-helix repeat-containing protein [Patescibacteria group bacterium]|nr:right-handed parallel beta-helix repeat-containing protein [Patescibacteria group bacterium]